MAGMLDWISNFANNQTFVGIVSSVAVLFVGFIFSEHLNEYKRRKRGIAILERLIRHNHARLTKNTELLKKWISCIDQKRAFKAEFSKLLVLSIDDTLLTSNVALVNELIRQNDFFIDYNEDLISNVYANYEAVLQMVVDEKMGISDWENYQENLLRQISDFPKRSDDSAKELIKLLAMIRAEWGIQKMSLVGIIYSLMVWNVWPRMTPKRVEVEIEKLHTKD